MTICFELEGGCRDGALQGVEASLQYLLTNGGELGRTFWLAPGPTTERWFTGEAFDDSEVAQRCQTQEYQAQEYQIVARAQRGDLLVISARHLPPHESTEASETDTVEFSPIRLCNV